MIRRVAGLAVVAVLVVAAPADADSAGRSSTAGDGSLAPTASQLAWARSKAVAYWHVPQPPCGRESVLNVALPNSWAGMADFAACSIALSTVNDWRDFPIELCRVYAHEFGHLVLGPTYFAATNPADPAHSPDPSNIMYAVPTWQQEEAEARSIGCMPPPPTAHHVKHRRSHPAGPRLALGGSYRGRALSSASSVVKAWWCPISSPLMLRKMRARPVSPPF